MAPRRWPLFTIREQHDSDSIRATVRSYLGNHVALVDEELDGSRGYWILAEQSPDRTAVEQLRSELGRQRQARPSIEGRMHGQERPDAGSLRALIADGEHFWTELNRLTLSSQASPASANAVSVQQLGRPPVSTRVSAAAAQGVYRARDEAQHDISSPARYEQSGHHPISRSFHDGYATSQSQLQQPASLKYWSPLAAQRSGDVSTGAKQSSGTSRQPTTSHGSVPSVVRTQHSSQLASTRLSQVPRMPKRHYSESSRAKSGNPARERSDSGGESSDDSNVTAAPIPRGRSKPVAYANPELQCTVRDPSPLCHTPDAPQRKPIKEPERYSEQVNIACRSSPAVRVPSHPIYGLSTAGVARTDASSAVKSGTGAAASTSEKLRAISPSLQQKLFVLSFEYAKNRELLDRAKVVQNRSYILLRLLRLSYQAAQSGESSDTGRASSSTSGSTESSQPSRKRKSARGFPHDAYDDQDGSREDDEDRQRPKRSRQAGGDGVQLTGDYLPCPFKVDSPIYYASHRDYPFISKLQTHLQDNHKIFACSKCLVLLPDRKTLGGHRHDKACSSKSCARHLPRGIQLLEDCDCLDSPEQQWSGLYRLCFPTDAVPETFAYWIPHAPRLPGELLTYSATEFEMPYPNISTASELMSQNVVSQIPAPQSISWPSNTHDANLRSPDAAASNSLAEIGDLVTQVKELQNSNAQILAQLRDCRKQQPEVIDLDHKIRRIQLALVGAERKAVGADFVRVVLDMVWERFKASGHDETKAGGALERLVAMIPRPSHEPLPFATPPCESEEPSDLCRVDSVLASAPSPNTWPDNFDFYLNS